jgi:hypothetical protein
MRRKKDGKIAPLILEPDITSKLALPSGSASPPVLWASRRKTGLHLRSSGDDCRMPAEGGVPSSESAHRERLQKHNNHAGHGSSYYDPEYARMEAWLDEHPDFVQDYFLRYMTECCDVERWRISMRPRCHPQIRHDPRRVPFKEQVDKLNVNSSELLRFFRFRITGNGLRKKQREFMVGQS